MASLLICAGYQHQELVLTVAGIQIGTAHGADDRALQSLPYLLQPFGRLQWLAFPVNESKEHQMRSGIFPSQHPDDVPVNIDKSQVIAAGCAKYVRIRS